MLERESLGLQIKLFELTENSPLLHSIWNFPLQRDSQGPLSGYIWKKEQIGL